MALTDKLKAIADQVRNLMGLTEKLSLEAMASKLNDASGEVTTQANLIAQISEVLEGKAAGGGGVDTRFNDLVENKLIEVDDDSITTARAYAFYEATNLVKVCLNNLTTLGSYTFKGCTALTEVDLPNFTNAVSTYSFDGCSALTQVNIPNATGANNYSFQDTTLLEKVELGVATTIGSYSFRRSGITALIIRNNATRLTKLSSTNAFTDCPIANGTGYIYFYREYVEQYKASTGWSNYADQIRAIEDYPEITGGA